jgi:hypothetical protein
MYQDRMYQDRMYQDRMYHGTKQRPSSRETASDPSTSTPTVYPRNLLPAAFRRGVHAPFIVGIGAAFKFRCYPPPSRCSFIKPRRPHLQAFDNLVLFDERVVLFAPCGDRLERLLSNLCGEPPSACVSTSKTDNPTDPRVLRSTYLIR